MRLPIRPFFADSSALSTVEFVAVFPGFLIISFFVLVIAVALFWWQTTQEAAELGARLALTSTPVVPTVSTEDGSACPPSNGVLPSTNCKLDGYNYGERCSTGACYDFGTVSCTDDACESAPFAVIKERMTSLFGPVSQGHITISYAYSGLGFAGGPAIPNVTVTVSGVPFGLASFFAPIGTILGLPDLTTVTSQTVTMTAEDLCTGDDSAVPQCSV